MTQSTLHITNGDAAADAIRAAGIGGAVLPWRDVLHEGPVPAGLPLAELSLVRAQFVGASGLDEYEHALTAFRTRDAVLETAERRDEVVLWFEHDLYDQLQLLQVLDWFAANPRPARLTLVQSDAYLGSLELEAYVALYQRRVAVTREQLDLAGTAWAAFRSPDPDAITSLLRVDTAPMPFLRGALERQLEEYPSTQNGLSRSERQILEALADGALSVAHAFHRAHHERERAVFLGDAVFATYLERLSDTGDPVVVFDDGTRIRAPRADYEVNGFPQRVVNRTDLAPVVAAGRVDWVRHNGIDRWLGGVHLVGRDVPWRWDPDRRRLTSG